MQDPKDAEGSPVFHAGTHWQFLFPLNSRFKSPILPLFGNLLGFSGCLLLDPLRFISYPLLIIVR